MDKETFKKEAQKKLDLLADKIDEIQKKLDPVTNELKDEAKVALEKTLVELKQTQAKLQVQFDEFKAIAGEKWDDAVKQFDKTSNKVIDKATVQINRIWEKLMDIF